MTKYLYPLCNGFMGLSFASIFVPNLYYHTKYVCDDFRDEFFCKNESVFHKYMLSIGFIGIFPGGIFLCFIKSMIYIFPPFCIYRHLLAYHYFKKTRDYNYISILHTPGSSCLIENNKYILKPFGNLSPRFL